MKNKGKSIFLVFCILLLFPQMVFAYIDPGTGSMVFQMLMATVFGALFAIKIYWKKIVIFLEKVLLLIREKNENTYK